MLPQQFFDTPLFAILLRSNKEIFTTAASKRGISSMLCLETETSVSGCILLTLLPLRLKNLHVLIYMFYIQMSSFMVVSTTIFI